MSGDYDNDGRPDLYVSVQGGDNLLFRNDGPAATTRGWRFTNVAEEAGVTEPNDSFGAFFFDYDNDGWPDLFVAGYGVFEPGRWRRTWPPTTWACPPRPSGAGSIDNKGDGTFETSPRPRASTRWSPPWGSTSATSTTTAGSTSTSAPATPTSAP